MDDLKIIFWIILGVIYLFARRKKSPTPPAGAPQEEEQSPDPSSQPIPKSFEELLREIQQMKEPAREPLPLPRQERAPEPEPKYVDYDDDLQDEKKDLEEAYDYRTEDKTYQAYEEAKAQAFNRPSLEETVKLEDTIVRFKQFKGYEREVRRNDASDILRDFKDPKGFRKAFIMSEILRRKF